MKAVKVLTFILAVSLIFSQISLAEGNDKEQNNDKTQVISIEDAVKTGLENSIELKEVLNEVDISKLTDERSRFLSKELNDASKTISDSSQQISMAQVALNNNTLPVAIDVPGVGHLSAGTDLSKLPASVSGAIKSQVSTQIQNSSKSLAEGEQDFSNALQDAGQTLSDKLNIASMESFGADSTGKLMTTMSQVSMEVTKDSYDIYKNQIAMLIKKSYYDALKAMKMADAKKAAMDRAQKQVEFADESFKIGMLAKDDKLLAEIYYNGTKIEYQKAVGDYNNAIIELKKNTGIPADTKISLKDVPADNIELPKLEDGLISGMKNRLEMKKSLGEETIYIANYEFAKGYYDPITFQYKEAELRKNKAVIEFEKTKRDVESSIRQSYETLKSTVQMMETSRDMVSKAKENVDIAQYKYKEGFGTDNSLMKKLNIESSAGTMVEVLAAEENLSDVEEKVVEITYGHNMARMKYYNDIGTNLY